MNTQRAVPRARRTRGASAFTLIEIAISLAIIAFALVAIIGVLPLGMQVQRDNREETIIDQDTIIYANALRSGIPTNSFYLTVTNAVFDQLTNAVSVIENNWTFYEVKPTLTNATDSGTARYTYTNGTGRVFQKTGPVNVPATYGISNGVRIVGLLSTPKFDYFPSVGFVSNYVVAYVRAISGPASERFPQDNPDVKQDAMRYKIYVENQEVPRPDYETGEAYGKNLRNNLRDVRLNFRWPLLPSGSPGNGRQVFRFQAAGHMAVIADPFDSTQQLFFLQPSMFARAEP